MTKTLGQIQKENRKFILEAIHNCSYEEIMHKEEIISASYNYAYKLENDVNLDDDDNDDTSIGKPINLNRVLKAIDPFGNYGCIAGHICKALNKKKATYAFVCEWNLELETLEEQSKETQRAINKILKENNK